MYNGFNTKQNYKVLEGASGGARTLVLQDRVLTSFNNLLAKSGTADSTRTLVAGILQVSLATHPHLSRHP